MSVNIKYKNNSIATLTDTGTKTLKTSGKYCEGDIIVENTKDGGSNELFHAEITPIQNRPSADGKGYRLKTDLTWEAYDLPPEPEPSDEDELSDAEALNVIMGVTA